MGTKHGANNPDIWFVLKPMSFDCFYIPVLSKTKTPMTGFLIVVYLKCRESSLIHG